jgi:hypothetical protein
MRIVIDGTEAQILGAEIALGMSSWLVNAQAQKRLMRPAVRRARCARDDFPGARSESSEIDGRDLAAFFEKGRNNVLRVRFGPFVPISVFFLGLACHGNTNVPPCALYPTKFGQGRFRKSQALSRFPITPAVCNGRLRA